MFVRKRNNEKYLEIILLPYLMYMGCFITFTVYPCKPVSTLTFVFGNIVSIITAGGAILAWIAVTWVDLN